MTFHFPSRLLLVSLRAQKRKERDGVSPSGPPFDQATKLFQFYFEVIPFVVVFLRRGKRPGEVTEQAQEGGLEHHSRTGCFMHTGLVRFPSLRFEELDLSYASVSPRPIQGFHCRPEPPVLLVLGLGSGRTDERGADLTLAGGAANVRSGLFDPSCVIFHQ